VVRRIEEMSYLNPSCEVLLRNLSKLKELEIWVNGRASEVHVFCPGTVFYAAWFFQ